jgi:predicted O-linked N-acetylglucosamine transferase (SPINDLY family)
MINFYLLTENISDDFKKKYNFYFRKFMFNYLLNIESSENNIILIKKELYPNKNYQKEIENIIKLNEPCYLSECKNIIYLPKYLYKIENNKVIYSDLDFKKNIIFESNLFCPFTCEKYKEISIEISNIYHLYSKNNNILYNKNIPIKYINEFINLELTDTKFYLFIFIINDKNYLHIINKIKDINYNYCRFFIINKIIQFDNNYILNNQIKILEKKYNKNIIVININLNNLPVFIYNIICPFENIILFNKDIIDFNIDETNEILKYYSNYINDNYIVLSASSFLYIPIYLSQNYNYQSLFKMILLNIHLLDKNKIYFKNIKKYNKYIKLEKLPVNYHLIEFKMILAKDYTNLNYVLDIHLNACKSSQELNMTIIKKITIAILSDTPINQIVLNILPSIEDIELLKNMYLIIINQKNDEIKQKILFKILEKTTDSNNNIFYIFELFKILITKDNIYKFFEIVTTNLELLLDKIKKELIIEILIKNLINEHKYEDANILEKFNDILIKLLDNSIIFDNYINLFNNSIVDKTISFILIISLITNFNPYYTSFNEFQLSRNKIYEKINELHKLVNNNISLLDVIKIPINNFHMSYQGVPSKEIFILKTNIYKKICPDLNYKIDTNFKNNKIKILFHAHQLNRTHSVYKDRHQVIKGLSEDKRFDVYFSTFDNLDNEVKFTFGNAKYIKLENNLENIKNILTKMKLDIIIYCEIGMYPTSYWMAQMKLAKIQCNTWGHSDTAGINTIDYFFSSKLYELPYEEAQTHYSEKLILQNSLCTSYINPLSKHNLANFKNRFHFGFTDDAIIYFCAQSLFKINPIYDEYIVKILKNVPNSIIVFLDGNEKTKILERLNNQGIGSQIKFLPMMNHFGYMNLMNVSDIFLDIYPFGGCNSSFEAFSLNKVIVTQPSIMINGRFTTGFYKKMDLEEYVCNSKEEYIDFAIKLGNDKEYRQSIEKKITKKKDCLFSDKESIQEWKDDLIKIYDDFHNN